MTYEVNPAGRADPVPRTEQPDDPNVMAPGGLISLEDITLPVPEVPEEDGPWPWDQGGSL